jgi:hypothetical protein
MKIGVLYICVGRYVLFWKDFYQSCEKHLIQGAEKHYFVFTDAVIPEEKDSRIHVYPTKKMGWPFDTLLRFEMFLKAESELKTMDYLYFFNANLKFVKDVGNEFLPDSREELVVALHPSFI